MKIHINSWRYFYAIYQCFYHRRDETKNRGHSWSNVQLFKILPTATESSDSIVRFDCWAFIRNVVNSFESSGYHSSKDDITSTSSLAPHGDRKSSDDVTKKQQRHHLKQIPRRAIQTITATYEEVKINLANARDKRGR